MAVLIGLNDDVWSEICTAVDHVCHADLLSLSVTCKRFRTIATPLVFRKPRLLTDCEEGFSRLPSINGWLSFVENSEQFAKFMRVLHIKMFALQAYDAIRLANILSAATNLQELQIITPESRGEMPRESEVGIS